MKHFILRMMLYVVLFFVVLALVGMGTKSGMVLFFVLAIAFEGALWFLCLRKKNGEQTLIYIREE